MSSLLALFQVLRYSNNIVLVPLLATIHWLMHWLAVLLWGALYAAALLAPAGATDLEEALAVRHVVEHALLVVEAVRHPARARHLLLGRLAP